MERRYVELDHANSIAAELREDGAPTIRGVAAVFNKPSHDLGGFREILLPGAFDAVLASKKLDVVGLWNHDPSQILGRTTSGTLRLAVDETRGLTYEIDPPDTQLGRDCQTLLRRRDVFGSSFAFTVNPSGETWTQPDKGLATRTISAVSGLFDVSVVTHPAYPQTSVAVRSLESWSEATQLVERSAGGLTISIDFDKTFSAAPGMWRSFVADATTRGNRVVCISRREQTEANVEDVRQAFGDAIDQVSALILCGPGSTKREAASTAGLEVDIWIDDAPETVGPVISARSPAGARAAAAALAARIAAHV